MKNISIMYLKLINKDSKNKYNIREIFYETLLILKKIMKLFFFFLTFFETFEN